MKKIKATLVTILIAVMLVIIDLGLFKLLPGGFFGLTGIFAAYGFSRAIVDFWSWLSSDTKELTQDLPPVFGEPADETAAEPEAFDADFDTIMEEMRGTQTTV